MFFAYLYSIWIFRRTDNRSRGYVTYFLCHGTRPSYKHIKIWGVRVYIINGFVTRKNLDDRQHFGYFMGYAATTWVIIYWNQDQPFVIHRAHNAWFDECTSLLSIEDNHTPGSLLPQQYTEIIIRNLYFLNLNPCELDFTSTPFSNTTILVYKI